MKRRSHVTPAALVFEVAVCAGEDEVSSTVSITMHMTLFLIRFGRSHHS